jgi:hypothetical protein
MAIDAVNNYIYSPHKFVALVGVKTWSSWTPRMRC